MAFKYDDYAESEEVKKKKEEAEKYKEYLASQSVTDAKNAWDAHQENKVGDWTGGTYGESLKAAMDRINNREKFSYDLNGDALYQQYKDQYITQGRMAMQDTMGQAAAMTGGYGNSYASTVGNQAYQGYLQKLNDVVPELYKLALDKYSLEGQELKDQYSLLKDQYNTEYGEHRDKVSDWYNEDSRLSNAYYNESNLDYSRYTDQRDYTTNEYNTERSYDYGLYSDAYNRAFANYQQEVSEKQAAAQLAASAASRAQSAAQHKEEMEYKYLTSGFTKDEDGNWVAPEKEGADPDMDAVNDFKSTLVPESQHDTVARKMYGSYSDYVTKKIKEAWEAGDLGDAEAEYLLSTLT